MQRGTSTLVISFLVRRSKSINGQYPLYARIKGLGKPTELSLKRYINPIYWDSTKGNLCGRGPIVQELQTFLDSVQFDLRSAYFELYRAGQKIDANAVKHRYLGVDIQEPRQLLEMFQYHFKRETGNLNNSTLKNYHTTAKYLKLYIKSKFKKCDFPLEELNYKFIDGFEVFLKDPENQIGARPLENNGIMKHMERLQKVVNLAIKLDELAKDPFKLYKRKMKEPEHVYLTMDELEKFETLTYETSGRQLAKDLFQLSCYTGLAYIDIMELTTNNLMFGLNGMHWIVGNRKKSGQKYRVPVLPNAQYVLDKYAQNQEALAREKYFPYLSAQKVNKYLKEMAQALNISKNLTFYVARHTFASTVTMAHGVPIETISKMMGHTKISTTQIYAKLIDSKVGSDMENLKQVLLKKIPNKQKIG